MVRKIIRISLVTILILLALFTSVTVLIRIPRVQTYLVQKIAGALSDKLHTKVSIGAVDIKFFKTAELKNFYIEDQRHDTLLSVGNLQANISVFSFFGKHVELNFTKLDDATIKIFRAHTDSDFNFKFIIDAFASKDTTTTKGGTKFKFSVDNFEMNNVRFVLRDENSANEVKVHLKHGKFNFNKMDLSVPLLDVKNAEIDKADVAFSDYSYLYPSAPETKDTSLVHLNTKAFKLICNKFLMIDCSFTADLDSLSPEKGQFDPQHISVSAINMDIENGTFIKDTIKGKFKDFSAIEERSGLTVKHITADTKITPKQITLNHLLIETNNSEVKDYFQMNYHDFRAFTEYPTQVSMKGNLKNCKVSFWDIACFAPSVKDVISKTLLADGEVTGPVNNLHARNLKLQFGETGVFYGDAELKGLPDVDETFADIDIKQFTATNYDLKALLPHLNLPDKVATLGQINFIGNFTGFLNDFVAYGSFTTAIGNVSTDVNFKINNQNHTSYEGRLSADNFNLGKYFGNDSLLGTISLNAQINGNGILVRDVSAQMNGDISQFVFNHYNYHNLSVYGKFDRKKFDGKLLVNDKNLNLDFSGNVDFNDSLPILNFVATLTDAHLRNIHFAQKDMVLNSTMNLNLTGDDIDNMIGNLNIEHTKFTLADKNYVIDSIRINSSKNSGKKILTVKSDMMDASLAGNFYLDGFYGSFVTMVKHYFPSWPIAPVEQPAKQDIVFTVTAKNILPFTKFFFPDVNGLNGSSFTGALKTSDNDVSLNGTIPEFDYKNIKFQTVDIKASVTGHDRLKITTNTKNLWLSDSTSIHDVNASFAVRNDSALCHLKAQDSAFYANRLNFNGWLIGMPDSIKFSFFKSGFYLNNLAWVIPDTNSIVYCKSYVLLKNLQLRSANGQMAFSGINSVGKNIITALFNNIKIEDFYNLLKIRDYSIYGLLNGQLSLINPLQRLHITSNLTIHNVRLNTDSLGEFVADINLDTTQQKVGFNFTLTKDSSNAQMVGTYNLTSDSGLDANVNLNHVQLSDAQPFLEGLASHIKGECNGTLQLTGSIDKPQLKGKVAIPSAEATVDYLKTHYKFFNETVDFSNNLISFRDVTLYDKDKNTATLGGEIIHDHLSEFRFNLYLNTKNLLMLNTSPKDNDLFYGTAYGSGTVLFSGPLNDLVIDVNARSQKNTLISIPISGGQNITDRNFIKFVSADTSVKNSEEALLDNGSLKLNLNLEITPEATIKIILDQTTGDIINGNGSGTLRMEINTAGAFNMYGTYTIESGSYKFTYQNIVNKQFSLQKGGTITWSGDPYKARINLSAIYQVQANISSLTSATQSTDAQTAGQTVPVNVVMNLTGSLLLPNIDFDINVPDEASTFSDLALSRLQQIRQDKNELDKQVFSLLLQKSFLPEQSSTITSLGTSTLTTSLSEFFTSQLSSLFSSINNTTNVNINYYSLSSVPGVNNQINATNEREFMAEVKQRLLNNRLTITVGGNIDVNSAPTSQNSNTNIAGDFDIDYLLTKDGRYTLKAFRKNQYDDIAQQNINVNGVGISFRKEFNNIRELFSRVRKNNNSSGL